MQAGGGAVMIGALVAGRYRVDSRLGEGGYGVVYVATQTNLGRQVALKVLHPEIIQRGDALARFEREAKLAQQLSHPNVVRIFDFGRTDDDVPFIVFELLVGRPLEREIAERGAMSEARVNHVAQQTVKGLMQAHGLGIVHRDIKPANIFLCDFDGEPDFVKVLDFGIAAGPVEKQDGAKLTQQGISLGTPAYMAPEQVVAQPVDGRADLYALGLVMSEMLTGAAVYAGTSAMHTALRQIEAAPVPLPTQVVACPLGRVIARATQKDPAARYGSALEMLDDLRGVARGVRSADPAPRPTQSLAEPAADLAHSATVAVPTPGRPGSSPQTTLSSAQPPPASNPAVQVQSAHGPNASISAQMFVPAPPPPPAAARRSGAVVVIVGLLALALLAGGGLAARRFGGVDFGEGRKSKKSASKKRVTSESKASAASASRDDERAEPADGAGNEAPSRDEPETSESPDVVDPGADLPGTQQEDGHLACRPLPKELTGVVIRGVGVETILERLRSGGFRCIARSSLDIDGRRIETFALEKGEVGLTVQVAPASLAQPAEEEMYPVVDASTGWAVTFMGEGPTAAAAIVYGQP